MALINYYNSHYSNSFKTTTITVDQLKTIQSTNIQSYNLNLKLWIIFNNTTQEISFIYKKGSDSTDWRNLESTDAESIELGAFLKDYDSSYHKYYIKSTPEFFSLNSPIPIQAGNFADTFIQGTNTFSTAPSQKNIYNFLSGGSSKSISFSNAYGSSLIYETFTNSYQFSRGNQFGSRFNLRVWQNFNFLNSSAVTFLDKTSGINKTLAITTFTTLGVSADDLSSILSRIEVKMTELKLLPLNSRFLNFNINAPVKLNFFNVNDTSKNLITLYFINVPTTNADVYQSKVLSPDVANIIQLPPPKYDKNGHPVRRYVKVTRTSMESNSPLISKKITLQKVTEVIPQQFSYPFSALVGTQIDSRAFSQIPTRTFLCKLKKVLVPSNYYPLIDNDEDVRYSTGNGRYKIYEGDWDGTFKLSWTNNPAWVLMDLLINKRYGLGNYIQSEQIDIWELYKIARWCDNVDDNGFYYGVNDSYGGVEPRFTFNGIIKDSFNIFDMINQVSSIFHGNVYYMNSLITFSDDRVKDPIGEFNNSDAKDGLFNYTNLKKDEEFTAVDITYLDSKDNFLAKIEYVENTEAIRKKGILKKTINTLGITSRGQAIRYARNFLFQTSKETSTVSFTTDSRALLYKPGDLIVVNDDLLNNYKNYGTVKSISDINQSTFKVVIDNCFDSNVVNMNEISLFTPIAKPKYEDIAYSAESIPKSICLELVSSSFLSRRLGASDASAIGFNNSPLTTSVLFLPSGDFDLETCAQNYSGLFQQSYFYNGLVTNKKSYNLELRYIKDIDLNNNFSKFGHWQLTTGGSGVYQDLYKFDYLADENLKSTSLYRKYFFNYIDTAIAYKYTNSEIGGSPDYLLYPKTSNETVNFQVKSYEKPTISFLDIIQNDKPSIETFQILSYSNSNYSENGEIYNNYTELVVSKSGIINGVFSKLKDSVKTNLDNLVVGSSYSLSLNHKKNSTYKIASISENYINEYNIIASEYNFDKFKQLEENYSIDDLRNTFNYIGAYNSYSDILSAVAIPAPTLDNLERVKYQNDNYILVSWSPVETANKYNLYILTPSKQTKNSAITFTSTDTYYDTDSKKFRYPFKIPSEIGTYTFFIEAYTDSTVEAMRRFSAQTSRTISVIDY